MKRYAKVGTLLAVMILAGVALCYASSGEGGDGRKIWNMVWRVINFAILIAILWKLLADKIKSYFGDRRLEIAKALDEVEHARSEAQAMHAEYESKLKNIEADISEVKELLIGEMESEKARIIEEGKVAAERIIQQAKWSAEQEVLKARKELNDQVVDMAGDMAAGLISKSMTPEDQRRILEEYLNEVVREN